MFLRDVRIVLCQVSRPGNVGAVCRAMKNMGLSDLRLASPQPMDAGQIRDRAVHAMDVWENARVFDSLAEAVADCSIIVGTTRRRGRRRKSVSMPPHALAAWLAERPGPAAIVFGSERTGLEDSELDLCNVASHIPTFSGGSPDLSSNSSGSGNGSDFEATNAQPSLNLSHAVQIYAYELLLALEPQTHVKGEWSAMNTPEISGLVGSITDTLESLGFYKKPGREEQTRFLRDVIARAGLSEREGKYLRDIFVKAARLGSMKIGDQGSGIGDQGCC